MASGDGSPESEMLGDWRDLNFAQNMVRLRTDAGLSQADLVSRLRESRWPSVHQTTISRIEKGERQARLSEAYLIADALGSSVGAMTLPPEVTAADAKLHRAVRTVADSYDALGQASWRLIDARRTLKKAVEEARAAVERNRINDRVDESLERRLSEAESYLALRIHRAVEAGREASEKPPGAYSDFARGFGADLSLQFIDQADIDAPDA